MSELCITCKNRHKFKAILSERCICTWYNTGNTVPVLDAPAVIPTSVNILLVIRINFVSVHRES